MERMMSDLLLMDKINALPQPLLVRICGNGWWPLYDVDVETGLIRLDIHGKLEVSHFGEVTAICDETGREHEPDDFYNEQERQAND